MKSAVPEHRDRAFRFPRAAQTAWPARPLNQPAMLWRGLPLVADQAETEPFVERHPQKNPAPPRCETTGAEPRVLTSAHIATDDGPRAAR